MVTVYLGHIISLMNLVTLCLYVFSLFYYISACLWIKSDSVELNGTRLHGMGESYMCICESFILNTY